MFVIMENIMKRPVYEYHLHNKEVKIMCTRTKIIIWVPHSHLRQSLCWWNACINLMQEHLFENSTSKNHQYFIWDSIIVHNGNNVIQF